MHVVRALTAIILSECSVILSAENLRERVLKINTFFHDINCNIYSNIFFLYKTDFIRFSSPLNYTNKTGFMNSLYHRLFLPASFIMITFPTVGKDA